MEKKKNSKCNCMISGSTRITFSLDILRFNLRKLSGKHCGCPYLHRIYFSFRILDFGCGKVLKSF